MTMPPRLFDSHVHLDAAEFDADRARVVRAAQAAGVAEMLLPATHAASWPQLHELTTGHAGLYPAYGLHPGYLDRHVDSDLARLADWLRRHPAVAVGECGLDLFAGHAPLEHQLHYFHGQLEIAHQFKLPLVLHARRAFEQVILELRRFGKPLRGVVHSFSGSSEQAHALAQLGFLVGIGGPVTHARARRLRRVVAELPLEWLLLETDAPDQADASHRGQRNEPAYLLEVLHSVAALCGDSIETIAAATTHNARMLFLGRP